jgi:hypothetical protein
VSYKKVRKMTNCRQIRKKLIFYIENELGADDTGLVRAHLEVCPDCSFLYGQINDSLQLIGADRKTDSNPFFYTRLNERLKNQADKQPLFGWLPKKQVILQAALYIVLGFMALTGGIYLGSVNPEIDEEIQTNITDTTDYQLFASSYNFNFNKSSYITDITNEEE